MSWQKDKALKAACDRWEAKVNAKRDELAQQIIPELEAWCFEHGCWLPQRLSGLTEEAVIAWLEERFKIEEEFRSKMQAVIMFHETLKRRIPPTPMTLRPLMRPIKKIEPEARAQLDLFAKGE